MNSTLMETILRRRSVRSFVPKPVARELLLQCADALRYAPSACDVQPWRLVLVDDVETKSRLARAAFSGIYRPTAFAAAAPVLAVLLTRFDWFVQGAGRRIQGTQYHLLDAGIAGEHFVLRAVELGLATCWLGWYNRRKVRRVLRIPARYRVNAMIAVGWPAVDYLPVDKPRRPLEEIVSFNSAEFRAD